MSAARRGGDRLVRTYVVTGGRSHASRNHFDHVTLVSLSGAAAHLGRAQLTPEHVRILEVLAGSAQSVAELAALLSLPLSVMRILLADLMDSGHISTGPRSTQSPETDRRTLLEDVLAGLRRL
ncbi:DUF742 domain-containing protein [Streptomyces sp. TS71-3]|jgi:hypothetical protein|uniref:DUF742 domain-containing protein n=1 Tax=Streptomyces sp. TS71-3 TaxID=2733862 RepID=UPI001B2CCC04|nr:DUF742 domain-containing protein [Streptomyces sp. TS71-3]GHJ36872.1 hypothetical protein Sm713_24810 [Streptomyces sp. TS71-3]